MFAELRNKVNSGNTNLDERSEDELTGNFFGNMRYLSFNKGLKKVLCDSIYPKTLAKVIEPIYLNEWSNHIAFWPRYREDDKQTEIDIVIELDELVVGIEVKYLSPLSSDDEIINEMGQHQESCNQLAREARLLKKISKGRKALLILLAKQVECSKIYENVQSRNIIEGVELGYISWQKVLRALKGLKGLNPYERTIINDVIELLVKKGFEEFEDFKVECSVNKAQYWSFNLKSDKELNFEGQPNVHRGGYYEFK